MGPAGVTERLENGQIQRIAANLPFGVPLYAEGELGCLADREGLDQSVGCCRFRLQTGCQCSHSLGVQGIDLGRTAACDLVKQPPGLEANLMGGAILHLDRLCLVFAVFDISTHLEQTLMQSAAEGDIHFLEAATDTQDRYALVDGLAA